MPSRSQTRQQLHTQEHKGAFSVFRGDNGSLLAFENFEEFLESAVTSMASTSTDEPECIVESDDRQL